MVIIDKYMEKPSKDLEKPETWGISRSVNPI